MTTTSFISKFCSKYLWKNLIMMAIVVIALLVAVAVGCDVYTHHGEEIKVPNICNKNFNDAEKLLENLGLQIVVTDTSYNRQLPADCVLQQMPASGVVVKSGRIVYVTINSRNQPTLVMPDIIDNSSLREATAKLRILGFKVGEPQYIAGEKDWVYAATCRGKNIVAGDKIPLDAMIILQVGNGTRNDDGDLEVTDKDYSLEAEEENTEEDPFEEVVVE